MADPRKTVAFDGVNEKRATYKIDNSTITYDKSKAGGSAQVGLAVKLSADKIVALTEDGNPVEGQLLEVYADNMALVQTGGYINPPAGDGATLTIGAKIVGALGAAAAKGRIRAVAAAAGAFAQATMQDALNGRGAIVDNDDTAKVIVRL